MGKCWCHQPNFIVTYDEKRHSWLIGRRQLIRVSKDMYLLVFLMEIAFPMEKSQVHGKNTYIQFIFHLESAFGPDFIRHCITNIFF